MKARWIKHTLHFKNPAGTSRGTLLDKPAYFFILPHQNGEGLVLGECGLLPGLSADDRPDYEDVLQQVVEALNNDKALPNLTEWPSIALGIDIALRAARAEKPQIIFPSAFTEGKSGIPINGLIWMGDKHKMQLQIDQKIKEGFTCVKMKIGAIDFEDELRLLKYIRERYTPEQMQLRVDANGAFSVQEALPKLEKLSKLGLHSIEQPIKAGQWHEMAQLCANSPLPIALDEELIGLFDHTLREEMMRIIRPQAIVLKPSFLGNFAESDHWIMLAEKYHAQWWITSALESNIGLNAIAQYTYIQNSPLHQGLGTGALYTNNIDAPMYIHQGSLKFDNNGRWDFGFLL